MRLIPRRSDPGDLLPDSTNRYVESIRRRTIDLFLHHAPREGYNLTALDDVRLLRSDRPLTRVPVLYEPGIVFVCEGSKRGYLGDQTYVYDAQHYLAVSVPLPFTMETDASTKEPLLAIYLRLDIASASALLFRIGHRRTAGVTGGSPPAGMSSTPLDAAMAASVLRLMQCLDSPLETEVLGPSVISEIYFRVLTGPQGDSMRAALAMQGHFGRIARALARIHASFDGPLDVATLADEAAMGPASFHAHFKAVTKCSPMQYLKSVRLHQARMLLVRGALTATAAASAVGYESASQFNREFRRLFGLPPLQEAERLRRAYALPASSRPSTYVSSH
jgi:AraC-like DNA-binding protein